ncbi:hypothetical protein FJT64_007147 [Amphibalanus amphitrite]|uniref:Uncharacterized protein n=1 Tax=Amphibalanus amphitrite TaxID=1232801 RepID=A0A6A4VMG1_AMPAM|nr:hypothetical protein FJT64_007147 [Amphibalanus amphitrite]
MSGIVAACRSELTVLEQLRARLDPLGTHRGASSPYQRPALAELTAAAQQWSELRTAAMAVERRADRRTQLRDRLRTFRHVLAVLDEQAGSAGRQLATVDDFEDRIGAVKVRPDHSSAD